LLAASSAIALWSCGGGNTAGSNTSGKPPGTADTAGSALVVRETGVGPIDGNVEVSVENVRALLPGYDVTGDASMTLTSDGGPGPPEIRVSSKGEDLLVIVPTERGHVLFALVLSSRVASQARWRVGDKLSDPSQLAGCNCVGAGLTCFTKGSHIGLIVDDHCTTKLEDDAMAGRDTVSREYRRLANGEPAALAALNGHTVQRLSWYPRALDSPRAATTAPPQ
jgi:hypothetical protein